MFEIQNDLGQIHFSRNVIYKICEDAAASCDGNVTIQNYKGRTPGKKPGLFSVFSPGEEEHPDIEITESEEGIAITLYVVVRFGTSMGQMVDRICEHIYTQTELVMNERPLSVSVIVTGTASRDIAKRHIEFHR